VTIKKYKQILLDQLYLPYKQCTSCPLSQLGRKNIVFGEGNPDAKLILIGEAPGRDEDQQNRPFVGKSGQLLNHILDALNICREEIYITNIVKCRPPNNRTPHPIESKTCKNILLYHQINIIKPKIMCTLGAAAIQGLLEQEVKITRIRGNPITWHQYVVIPTYHPAYILRNPRELSHLAEDLESAAKLINSD
jgi:uracil-DNA glycosylase